MEFKKLLICSYSKMFCNFFTQFSLSISEIIHLKVQLFTSEELALEVIRKKVHISFLESAT